ncbi:hypothetical protein DFS34DRAFT_627960 [Phlyctochytrium arcticum]|nr:hypothetical protein DFS34DRAFT_627960 [Phlyctochytrium arcticum]
MSVRQDRALVLLAATCWVVVALLNPECTESIPERFRNTGVYALISSSWSSCTTTLSGRAEDPMVKVRLGRDVEAAATAADTTSEPGFRNFLQNRWICLMSILRRLPSFNSSSP